MITIEQLKDVKERTEALHRYLDIDNKKVQVEEEQIYAIPEAVRSSRNQYMDRMAALDAEEEKGKLAFIVVPSLLIPRPVL